MKVLYWNHYLSLPILVTFLQQLLRNTFKQTESKEFNFNSDCIVPVRIKTQGKGTPKKFGIICIPEQRDLICKKPPVEPIWDDKNESHRKEMRENHRNLLKTLRKRRIRAKQNGKVSYIYFTYNVIHYN